MPIVEPASGLDPLADRFGAVVCWPQGLVGLHAVMIPSFYCTEEPGGCFRSSFSSEFCSGGREGEEVSEQVAGGGWVGLFGKYHCPHKHYRPKKSGGINLGKYYSMIAD